MSRKIFISKNRVKFYSTSPFGRKYCLYLKCIVQLFMAVILATITLSTPEKKNIIFTLAMFNKTVLLSVSPKEMQKKSLSHYSSNVKVIPRPLVVCGPSGVGKGTLINILMKQFPAGEFAFSTSHTTRLPRDGEEDGVHYHFVTLEDMKADISCGKFIEYAQVHGNYYGTSIKAVQSVLSEGRVCLLDIDIQGAQQIKKSLLDPFYIFIAPPSIRVLEERLRRRGSESEKDIATRINNAMQELAYGEEDGNFDRFLINDNLTKSCEDFLNQIMEWYPHLN